MAIGTRSNLGSGNQMRVRFENGNDLAAGGVTLQFASQMKFWLDQCSVRYAPLSDLPVREGADRVWRITILWIKGNRRLLIHDDDVKVLEITLSEQTCADWRWREVWYRNVRKIVFPDSDTASVDYGIYIYHGGKLL